MRPSKLDRFIRHTRQERIAVLLLIFLFLVILVIYVYIRWHPSIPGYTLQVLESLDENKVLDSSVLNEHPVLKEEKLFLFNPNIVSQVDLIGFGLPAKTARAWVHYLEKGGKFKQPEDVKKIFGMNELLFNKISTYIRLEIKKQEETITYSTEKNNRIAIDPNRAAFDELVQSGFPPRIANTLIHFRSSGKRFKSLYDISKIYGMNDSLLQFLTPYLIFKDSTEISSLSETKIISSGIIDLNKADSTLLKRLPGIGHVLALRIIAYREKLGGFYSVDQLKEVYGLRDTTLLKFKSNIMLTDPYRKIKINGDTLSILSHPYLSKKDAIIIQNFRDQHGEFKSLEDLQRIRVFDQNYWERLLPYLDFTI